MRFDWDNHKSQLLQQSRGYSLEEVSIVLAGEYVEQIKRDDPEQFIAVGYLENTLLSVIYEIRYDDEGDYIWLITIGKVRKGSEKSMSNISTEELEHKIEAGEEVVDRYFDSTTTRIGTPRPMTSRRHQDVLTTHLDIPNPMLDELDQMARELNISRQAVIKMMLRRALDEHYLAKRLIV